MTDHSRPDTTTPLKMDRAWLAELGLADLPSDVQADLLKTAYDTLEYRVGSRIAQRLSGEDLDRFENIFQQHDDEAALAFLQHKCPDYSLVVRSELSLLQAEIRRAAPVILAELGILDEAPIS